MNAGGVLIRVPNQDQRRLTKLEALIQKTKTANDPDTKDYLAGLEKAYRIVRGIDLE